MPVGDYVKVKTAEEDIEGILMPEEKETVVLKLSTGYNIGINKKRVKEIIVLKEKKDVKIPAPKIEQKEGLPKISILQIGGTIASKVDYVTGGVSAFFQPEEILSRFPEIKNIASISSRLISNMFSEDMRFAHYNIIAKEIEKEIKKGCAGVILPHGTDTMAHTAAALSFMLENLPVPVILVGAQRSSDRGSTDAALNVLSAALFIVTHKEFTDVAICMHETVDDKACLILPATKTRKMHSSRRDAFRAINTTPWARVDYNAKKVDFLRLGFAKKTTKALTITNIKENLKIGIAYSHPNFSSQELLCYEGYDGLIIMGTGLGHLPVDVVDEHTKEHGAVLEAARTLAKKGTIVAMATQAIFGKVDMNVYSSGRKQLEAGILGNYTDMTAETAFIKLAWLLSNYPKDKVRELYGKNLRGEISEKLEKTDDTYP